MIVWRLDCSHAETLDSVTFFFRGKLHGEARQSELSRAGWECDLYEEDLPAAQNAVALLTSVPWPCQSAAWIAKRLCAAGRPPILQQLDAAIGAQARKAGIPAGDRGQEENTGEPLSALVQAIDRVQGK